MRHRLGGLDFIDRDLSVRYSASLEPQELSIAFDFARENRTVYPSMHALDFQDFITLGFMGSNVFPPEAGAAEIVSLLPGGDPSRAWGTHFEIILRVAAVAPIALRHIVERLRLTADPANRTFVQSMAIRGSRPPDGGPLSVTEEAVKSWLDDPNVSPHPWPHVPFPIKQKSSPRGALWRVSLAARPDADTRKKLENVAIRLVGCWDFDDVGAPVPGRKQAEALPTFFVAKQEFTARYSTFPWNKAVIRGLLANALVAFHHKHIPILELELSL